VFSMRDHIFVFQASVFAARVSVESVSGISIRQAFRPKACEILGVSLCCFYNSIAMAKRILPGTFCLEHCPVNLPQATPKVTRN
jgi:hypothetical protein